MRKLTNSQEILEFRFAVSKCKGHVYLQDNEGNQFNLKSVVSQYIALGALLQDGALALKLICSNPKDEQHFKKFIDN